MRIGPDSGIHPVKQNSAQGATMTALPDRAPRSDSDTIRAKTLRGLILARRLDTARRGRGYTTRKLAGEMSMSAAMVNRVMTGRRVPTALEIGGLCALLDIRPDHRQVLYRLAATADRTDWIIRHGHDGPNPVRDLEALATTITTYEPDLLPAALRTPAYHRATRQPRDLERPEPDTRRKSVYLVPARVLDDHDLPGEVRHTQLRHLLAEPQRVRVLPRAAPRQAAFRVLEIDNFPPVVHIEHHTTSIVLERPDSTTATAALLAELRALARPERDTTPILRDLLSLIGGA